MCQGGTIMETQNIEAMPKEDIRALAHEIAQGIEGEVNVRTIFGEPIKLDGHVIVPVATVSLTIGGGGAFANGGRLAKAANEVASRVVPGGFGGGGGFQMQIRPVGFIRDGKEGVEFSPIEVPSKELH
jgi:uncharacterized spore protein YtfJ